MSIWDGRFSEKMNPDFEIFNRSFETDQRLVLEDIQGSLAYAEALQKIDILTMKELKNIVDGLNEIRTEITNHPALLKESVDEDIHSYVENSLVKKIGPTGLKLHTGRSRNEQVSVDTRLFVKKKINETKQRLKDLMSELIKSARVHEELVIPGYTHLRKAQPVLLSHYFLAYFEMFLRDYQRFDESFQRTDSSPLGSGALAGCSFPIDRKFLAEKLGFSEITHNSLDAVSDRDYILDFLFSASTTLVHLSRLAEDLIIFSTPEFGWIILSDKVTTGSSLLPQKKNPDALELIRGKSSRLIGNLSTLLILLKGTPLTYNKDLQDDKELLFNSSDTVLECLHISKIIIETMEIDSKAVKKALNDDSIFATDIADYLVRKGVPFRSAHKITGSIVLECEQKKIKLSELSLDRYKTYSLLFEDDIFKLFTLNNSINSHSVVGGTSHDRVKGELARAEKRLKHLIIQEFKK